MLKLKFRQSYLSIKEMDDVILDDFSILTGLNGTGKTHLFHAIKNGSIEIEGILQQEVIYFNYSDFQINPEINPSKVNDNSNQIKNDLFLQHSQNLANLQREAKRIEDAFDKAISYLITSPSFFDNENTIGTKKRF